jgi:ceramide synthetase
MYLHDIADIFTSFVRCFTETTLTSASVFNALGMTLSWGFTRLFVFPIMIYYTQVPSDFYFYPAALADRYFGVLLSVLLILHYYWYFVLLKSLTRFWKKGTADDLQQRIVKKEKK